MCGRPAGWHCINAACKLHRIYPCPCACNEQLRPARQPCTPYTLTVSDPIVTTHSQGATTESLAVNVQELRPPAAYNCAVQHAGCNKCPPPWAPRAHAHAQHNMVVSAKTPEASHFNTLTISDSIITTL